MEKLSLVLWRERELLDELLYRLEVEQLVLASGRTNWLMRSAREVEATLQNLRETEVLRAVAADVAAETLGLRPNPSLRELAEASPEPWQSILNDHRDSFATSTRQVMELADANRDLITSGYRSAREALLAIDDQAPQSYSPDGTGVSAPTSHRLLDRSL
ncbi:MAG: flagellar protein FlgN [Nocardioides sp.]